MTTTSGTPSGTPLLVVPFEHWSREKATGIRVSPDWLSSKKWLTGH
jgi:hypothetical protein